LKCEKGDSPDQRAKDKPVKREDQPEEKWDEEGGQDVPIEDVDGEELEEAAATG
jgi:hypothetical protein